MDAKVSFILDWKSQKQQMNWANVSSVLIGEYVGLEEVDDGQRDVYFANYRLGRLNERFMRIEDAFGRLKRRV